MAGLSPTQRTLKYLKDEGYRCGIVERWIQAIRKRQDLFNIIDIIALDPDKGVIGVQSTGQDFAGHYRKLTEEKAAETRMWLETPGTSLMLIGWRKLKLKRGGKAMRWTPRIQEITLEDLTHEVSDDPT
jgi:hypothetical protein